MSEYRLSSEIGDLVELPNGKFGIIKNYEIICGGHVKRVVIKPLFIGFLRRVARSFTGKNNFYENQINNLKLILPAKKHLSHPYR